MNWQNKIYNQLLETNDERPRPETAEFEVSNAIAALRKSGHIGGNAKPTPKSIALKAKAMDLITRGKLIKPKDDTATDDEKDR